jgi:hypothetical protein
MIGNHGDDFADRNVFLHVALGIVAASVRLDQVLARYGRGPVTGDPATPEDRALIEFVLGLVSFRNAALRTLTAARHAPREAAPSGIAPIDGLLR